MRAQQKVVQYLNEAHALEGALVQTLTTHIAITPRGRYRDLLERHLDETREHARRIEDRLGELGESRNPLQVAYGLAQTVVGQLLSLGKAPLDLLRGTEGEEKLLKNARDECATEALEIATYDSLEALAEAIGDERTELLAREHRAQEEHMLAELRALIPDLTLDVASAALEGVGTYDVTTTGAADALRRAGGLTRDAARQARDGAEQTAGEARAATRAAAADTAAAGRRGVATALGGAAEAVDEAEDLVEDAGERAADVLDEAEDRLEGAAERAGRGSERRGDGTPGVREVAGEVQGVAASADELAIAGYDALTVEEILPKLKLLGEEELAQVDGYEREHQARRRVLDRVGELREREGASAR